MAKRLDQAGRDGVDAVVAAAAALQRLGEASRIVEYLDPAWFVPQVGQGALALECRNGDTQTLGAIAVLNDPLAALALEAERAFLRELGAGCSIPVGAHARFHDGAISISGVMADPDGARSVRHTLSDSDPVVAGTVLARYLRDECGGGALIGPRNQSGEAS
jgi:hydroxymethylbilane synthase